MTTTALERKSLLFAFVAGCILSIQAENAYRIRPLAEDYVIVTNSPDPKTTYCYTPGLCRLDDGRLVATMDWGHRDATKRQTREGHGDAFVSDDRGATWRHVLSFPFMHARPFMAGGSLYLMGHDADHGYGDLCILRSDDRGETWTRPAKLTDGQSWHQSACNVWYANSFVYLVQERSLPGNRWCNGLAPVLMRGRVDADLTLRMNWSFASELTFDQALPGPGDAKPTDYFGVPFANSDKSLPGWLETNVVQMENPKHRWYDPSGKTFYLFMRSWTLGMNGYACMAKVTENADGSMTTGLVSAPSGKKMLYVPLPGGYMRFHMLYDGVTKLYWLLGSQCEDSLMKDDIVGDRTRLVLHFSRNLLDWNFAGFVCAGKGRNQSRHYASMVVDGDNLDILSRSGDENSYNAHDTDMITFHVVRDFRSLVY